MVQLEMLKLQKKMRNYNKFKKALNEVNKTLAMMMAGDGEGATALFETKVIGAKTIEDAKILAKSVICSGLTKAAIYGHDANWGRAFYVHLVIAPMYRA